MDCILENSIQKVKLKVSIHAGDLLVGESYDLSLWNLVLCEMLKLQEIENQKKESRGVGKAD